MEHSIVYFVEIIHNNKTTNKTTIISPSAGTCNMRVIEVIIDVRRSVSDDANMTNMRYRASSPTPCEPSSQDGV